MNVTNTLRERILLSTTIAICHRNNAFIMIDLSQFFLSLFNQSNLLLLFLQYLLCPKAENSSQSASISISINGLNIGLNHSLLVYYCIHMLLCNVSLPLLCSHFIKSATFTINCLLLLSFNGGKCYNFKQAHIEPYTSLITNQLFLVATSCTNQTNLIKRQFSSLPFFLSVLFKQQQLIMINEPRRYALYTWPRRQKENPMMMIIRRLKDTPLAHFLNIYMYIFNLFFISQID